MKGPRGDVLLITYYMPRKYKETRAICKYLLDRGIEIIIWHYGSLENAYIYVVYILVLMPR